MPRKILFLLTLWTSIKPGDLIQTTFSKYRDDSSLYCHTDEQLDDGIDVLYGIVAGLNWTSVRVFTDNSTEGCWGVVKVLTERGIGPFRVTVFTRLDSQYVHHLNSNRFFEDATERLHLIFCRLDCVEKVIRVVTEEVSAGFLFASTWLVVTDSQVPSNMTGKLENLAYLYPEVSPVSNTSQCSLEMMTLDTSNGGRSFIAVPQFSIHINNNRKSSGYREQIFPNLNRGLNGRTLLVGVEEWLPYVKKIGADDYSGLGVDLIEELGKAINFRIKYVELPAQEFVWRKLLQMLIDKELDVLACPLMQSPSRAVGMDFTYQVAFSKVQAYYRRPSEAELNWRLLIDLLSWPVIALTVSALFCTAMVLGMFHSVRRQEPLICSRALRGQLGRRVRDMSWFLFGNLLNQGQMSRVDTALSSRLVVASWCVFCLVLTVTFTAHLVPALGVIKHPVLFRTLRDLLNNGDYKWGLYGDENWAISYLRDSERADHRDLYTGVISSNRTDGEVLSHWVHVHERKVLTENYVYINSHDSTQKFYANHCDVVVIEERLMEIPTSFPLPKNSPYKQLFSQGIIDFHENGQMDRWKQKWLPKRGCTVEKTKSVSLDLVYLEGVFIVIVFGVSLSVAVFLCEAWVQRFVSSKQTTKEKDNKQKNSCDCRDGKNCLNAKTKRGCV